MHLFDQLVDVLAREVLRFDLTDESSKLVKRVRFIVEYSGHGEPVSSKALIHIWFVGGSDLALDIRSGLAIDRVKYHIATVGKILLAEFVMSAGTDLARALDVLV